MGKEQIILGSILIIGGIFLIIFIKGITLYIYSTALILIGLALIIYRKEEDKIERRKDKK